MKKTMIGNVVLGIGVIGLGALAMAERGVSGAHRAAEAQAVAKAEAAKAEAGVVPAPPPQPSTGTVDAGSGTGTDAGSGATSPLEPAAKVTAPQPKPEPLVPIPGIVVDPDELDPGARAEASTAAKPGPKPQPEGAGGIPASRLAKHTVVAGDTLTKIARASKVTIGLLRRMNRLKDDDIRVGQTLQVPKGPFRAGVDRANFSLTIYLDDAAVRRYAIGVGRGGCTPAGEFEVRSRVEDPEWRSPEGDFFRAGDPENPLGARWMGFGESGVGIHGTTDPSSIGKEASRGCIRLNNDDVLEVYDFLGFGSRVKIE